MSALLANSVLLGPLKRRPTSRCPTSFWQVKHLPRCRASFCCLKPNHWGQDPAGSFRRRPPRFQLLGLAGPTLTQPPAWASVLHVLERRRADLSLSSSLAILGRAAKRPKRICGSWTMAHRSDSDRSGGVPRLRDAVRASMALALAYFAYNRGLPLTVRANLQTRSSASAFTEESATSIDITGQRWRRCSA